MAAPLQAAEWASAAGRVKLLRGPTEDNAEIVVRKGLVG